MFFYIYMYAVSWVYLGEFLVQPPPNEFVRVIEA